MAAEVYLFKIDKSACVDGGCCRFATNHGLIRSLCGVAWAPAIGDTR
jgi:hypothetical protein